MERNVLRDHSKNLSELSVTRFFGHPFDFLVANVLLGLVFFGFYFLVQCFSLTSSIGSLSYTMRQC